MTLTEQAQEQNAFNDSLEALLNEASSDHPLAKFKAMAAERFKDMGLPAKSDERYKYVKLRSLYEQEYVHVAPTAIDIAPYILPESLGAALVFVNGIYQPQLSQVEALPSNMVILPLSVAMHSYGPLLNNRLTKTCRDETDPFALLNLALHHEGAFLYLPPRTRCQTPIQIIHVIDSDTHSTISFPRLQLFVGSGSELTIASTHISESQISHCINQVLDVQIEENGHLNYIQSNCHSNAKLWHFDAVRADLKRDARLEALSATLGCSALRHDSRIILAGTNAEAHLYGVWMLKDKLEAHHNVHIEHQAPNCNSRQLFKGVLDDNSRSSFEGKIFVHKEAQKTNAFQLNNNLLLSDVALAFSKPNLEIFADDVKASHGATVGQLDKEELFYMRSRGFNASQAKNVLLYAFCQEVIDQITIPSLKASISASARLCLKD